MQIDWLWGTGRGGVNYIWHFNSPAISRLIIICNSLNPSSATYNLQQTSISNLPLFQKQQIKHDFLWESYAGRRFTCNIMPYFFSKIRKDVTNLSSAAAVIAALRFKWYFNRMWNTMHFCSAKCHLNQEHITKLMLFPCNDHKIMYEMIQTYTQKNKWRIFKFSFTCNIQYIKN